MKVWIILACIDFNAKPITGLNLVLKYSEIKSLAPAGNAANAAAAVATTP